MKILLTEWAKRNFDPPPANRILLNWAKTGQIRPLPVKVGRPYYVDENAVYTPLKIVGDDKQLSERAKRIVYGT